MSLYAAGLLVYVEAVHSYTGFMLPVTLYLKSGGTEGEQLRAATHSGSSIMTGTAPNLGAPEARAYVM